MSTTVDESDEATPHAESGGAKDPRGQAQSGRRSRIGRYSIGAILALLVIASVATFIATRVSPALPHLPSPSPTLPRHSEIAQVTVEGIAVPQKEWIELLAALRLQKPSNETFGSDVLVAQRSIDICRNNRSRLVVYLDYDDEGRIWVTLFDSETKKGSVSLAASPDALDGVVERAIRPQPDE